MKYIGKGIATVGVFLPLAVAAYVEPGATVVMTMLYIVIGPVALLAIWEND